MKLINKNHKRLLHSQKLTNMSINSHRNILRGAHYLDPSKYPAITRIATAMTNQMLLENKSNYPIGPFSSRKLVNSRNLVKSPSRAYLSSKSSLYSTNVGMVNVANVVVTNMSDSKSGSKYTLLSNILKGLSIHHNTIGFNRTHDTQTEIEKIVASGFNLHALNKSTNVNEIDSNFLGGTVRDFI